MAVKILHKGAGHRKRLRQRFLQSGFDGFLDYEIVELLLTLGTPRKDCKQMAKDAIKEFKGLREVLNSSLEELQKIKGIGPSNAFGIKVFQAVSERLAHEQITDKIKFNSANSVAQYLQTSIGREKKEHFVVLCLDSHNNLIKMNKLAKISKISTGSLNASIVHPREVFKEAIQSSAAQIIIAHNHPSGDLEPSDEDLRLTQRLQSVGELTGIPVIDHFIVSSAGYISFKEKNLL